MTNQIEHQTLAEDRSTAQVSELEEKAERIGRLLDRQKLSALLLSRHENIAWATAGQVEARVALGSEVAVASLRRAAAPAGAQHARPDERHQRPNLHGFTHDNESGRRATRFP